MLKVHALRQAVQRLAVDAGEDQLGLERHALGCYARIGQHGALGGRRIRRRGGVGAYSARDVNENTAAGEGCLRKTRGRITRKS